MNGASDKQLNSEMAQSPEASPRRRYGEPKPLSQSEVCAILDTCLRCGVSSFSFNGLVVAFGSQPPGTHEAVLAGSPSSSQEDESHGRLNGLAGLVDDELEMLKITNPVLYEKHMADGANS